MYKYDLRSAIKTSYRHTETDFMPQRLANTIAFMTRINVTEKCPFAKKNRSLHVKSVHPEYKGSRKFTSHEKFPLLTFHP